MKDIVELASPWRQANQGASLKAARSRTKARIWAGLAILELWRLHVRCGLVRVFQLEAACDVRWQRTINHYSRLETLVP